MGEELQTWEVYNWNLCPNIKFLFAVFIVSIILVEWKFSTAFLHDKDSYGLNKFWIISRNCAY